MIEEERPLLTPIDAVVTTELHRKLEASCPECSCPMTPGGYAVAAAGQLVCSYECPACAGESMTVFEGVVVLGSLQE